MFLAALNTKQDEVNIQSKYIKAAVATEHSNVWRYERSERTSMRASKQAGEAIEQPKQAGRQARRV